MRLPATFLLLIVASTLLQAQEGQPRFRQLGVSEGLSHNQVTCFFKDSKGFVWIGTASGLNRFDGYTIRVFTHDAADPASIPHNFVSRIFQGPGGRMGVMTNAGLSLYDPATERFENNLETIYRLLDIPEGTVRDVITNDRGNCWILHSTGLYKFDFSSGTSLPIRHDSSDTTTIGASIVTAVTQDREGKTWVMNQDGLLEQIALRDGRYKATHRYDFLQERNDAGQYDYRILADFDGDLWIHSMNDTQGVYWFKPSTGQFRQFTRGAGDLQLNTNIVTALVQDDEGMIWVGTDHGGINLINKKDLSVTYVYHDIEDINSLAQNSIIALYKDSEGIIWTGTFKRGLSYYHRNIIRFPVYRHFLQDPHSLPFNDVNRFVEDAMGNLWIGTNGGGLIYFDRRRSSFTQYRNDPADPESISSDVIVSLCIDSKGTLWIGTYYGGLNSFDGKVFTRYDHDPDDPGSLSDRNVWEIFEDSQNRLWIGTIGGGLDLLDRNAGTFSHYRTGDINSVTSNYITAITEDDRHNLWVGTGAGISVLMRETGRFIYYQQDASNPGSLGNSNIFDIRQDSKGRIWVGTEGGLNLFDPETKTFRVFRESDGLPHNSVLTILEGNNNDLWMGTPNGLSNLIIGGSSLVPTYTFKNYDEPDGLQGKQFNENAAFRTSRGELIFGGPNGFNLFRPEEIGINTNPPEVVLSDFQLFNRSVRGGEPVDGRIILAEAITEATQVVLPYSKNVFSLEFAALNFFHPERNQYRYKLEGFDEDWTIADSQSRKVTYTNLDPDEYTFRVIAANHDGSWNQEGASLKITVLPPFWKTKTAIFLYFLVMIGGLLLARKMIQQREQMKYAIEAERKEAMRMHELDMMKIKFFTNVSHEFRTPLTLILTPLDRILKQVTDTPLQSQLTLVQRNARRLLNLVNQLLDFRKLETQEIRFNPCEGDVIAFIRETVYSFSDLSEKKDIKLSLTTQMSTLETIFDQDKLEKILFNLLSNAFKFTPEHGEVSVGVSTEEREGRNWLVLEVTDTGIGIAPDKLDKIFDRFFQSDTPVSLLNQGSGIGLAITREFTRIHGGTITAESEPGQGSSFVVRLPVNTVVHESFHASREVLSFDESNSRALAVNAGKGLSKKPVLLLVEDNEDFRFYLKDNLRLEFTIIEAGNGKEGLKQALKHTPDLVVSDIMMPEMDGVELCKRLKEERHTARIPVILLTARIADEQKLQGLVAGADDYITKPFNFEILAARIKNLIALRVRSGQVAPQVAVKASELNITPLDDKFIQDAIRCVEENVSSPDFTVEDLSHSLGMSRANLYKKILALTSKSPLEFIRTIRLQQAAQLLEKSQLTVAEIAYRVGFNNPKYFARYFREAYKVLPSVYAMEKRKGRG